MLIYNATAMVACIPFYGIIGYNTVTFTKEKERKKLVLAVRIFYMEYQLL